MELVNSENTTLDENQLTIQKIKEIVDKHEDILRHHYASDLPKKLEVVINNYQRKTSETLRASENFRDKSLLHLRALAMCLHMTGNAQTHGEKNARLRGAIEIIEATIEKLEQETFNLHDFFSIRSVENGFVFRSSYPVRELLQENEQLKIKIEMYENQQSETENFEG